MATFSLHHLHHETADVDATVSFYCDNFGGEIAERTERDGVQWARVTIGGAMMNVTDRGDTKVGLSRYEGLDHFGLQTDDFDGAIAALKKNGVQFFIEPMSPSPGVQIAFVVGPDNIKIELLHVFS
ncbi:MAG: lactoylglutathione lyase [Gammaproteobacteria bacterium]|jgi:lactoylglutathione lyase